jgi:hypothetical protein
LNGPNPDYNDPRLLQIPSMPGWTGNTYYFGTTFTATFYFDDGLIHSVAIYCVYADRGGRYQTVTVDDVTNPGNPVLLDPARDVSDFATTGVCMVYNVSGHVQFTINLTEGPNAVSSAWFIDASRSLSTVAHAAESGPTPDWLIAVATR